MAMKKSRMTFSFATAAALLAASITAVPAESKSQEYERKLQACRSGAGALIGISRAELRARCPAPARTNTSFTASGESEQIVYGHIFEGGPFLYVYVDNGVVTSVQRRGR